MGNIIGDIFGGGAQNTANQDTASAGNAFNSAGNILGQEGNAFSTYFGPLMSSFLTSSGYNPATGTWDSSDLTNKIANQTTEGQIPQYQNALSSAQHDAVSSGFAGQNSWTPEQEAQIRQTQASDAQKNYETAGQDAYSRQATAFSGLSGIGQSAASGYNNIGNSYLGGANQAQNSANQADNGIVSGITSLAGLWGGTGPFAKA